MVARARQLRYRWVGKASLYLIPISVLLCIVAMVYAPGPQRPKSAAESVGAVLLWLPGVLTGLVALGLPLWRFLSNRWYDPNAIDVETRKQLGRNQAVPKMEFEQRQAELAAAQDRATNRTKKWRTARKRSEPGAAADGPSEGDL
jgi:hypothetical protein